MTALRMTTAAFALATLAACGGGELEVRDGPQAVHPSPYPLAQGVVAETAPTTCGGYHNTCHHAKHHANHHSAHDGSTPIVD